MSKQKLFMCLNFDFTSSDFISSREIKTVNPDQVLVGLTWELLGLEPPVLIRDLSALTTDF